MAVKSEDPETRVLLAYAQIIVDMARKHSGTGWLAYDTHFRAQFAGGPFKWNEVKTVFGNPRLGEGAHSCSRCMSADHSSSECTMQSLEQVKPFQQPLATSRPSTPTRPHGLTPPATQPRTNAEEPCRRFNKGRCSSRSCRYDHYCNSCFKGAHPATECRNKDTRGRKGGKEAIRQK